MSIVGQKFTKLTALKPVSPDRPQAQWHCKCDCGNEITAYYRNLIRGAVKSCGCKRGANPKHQLSESRTYRIWKMMKQRCYNPNSEGYENYGGRGIRVHSDWHKFENFYRDMGHCPENKTLDRIDTNKDYSKENCKWSTWKEQHNNRRDNHLLTAFGKTQSLTMWSEETKIPINTLKNRMYRSSIKKMTLEEAIKASSYAQQRGKLT